VTGVDERTRTADRALRERARAVIPGGMYGHQAAGSLPPEYPQFMRGGRGARVWDVDGNSYVDLMCSYGPVVLGHRHPEVEAADVRPTGRSRRPARRHSCQTRRTA
jgi:glutamate-1-semialdehyde 2,1-aminomutase